MGTQPSVLVKAKDPGDLRELNSAKEVWSRYRVILYENKYI